MLNWEKIQERIRGWSWKKKMIFGVIGFGMIPLLAGVFAVTALAFPPLLFLILLGAIVFFIRQCKQIRIEAVALYKKKQEEREAKREAIRVFKNKIQLALSESGVDQAKVLSSPDMIVGLTRKGDQLVVLHTKNYDVAKNTYFSKDILKVEISSITEMKTERSGSAFTGAIGFMMAGPLGAVVGYAAGGTTKNELVTNGYQVKVLVNNSNEPVYCLNIQDQNTADFWYGRLTMLKGL